MARDAHRRLWSLGFLAAAPLWSCAGFTSPHPERVVVLESRLAPDEAAWAASVFLTEQVPGAGKEDSVPATRFRKGYLLEARARPGGLYRFRCGGGFWGKAPAPALAQPEHLLERMAPLALVPRAWAPAPEAPFPVFFDRFLRLEVAAQGPEGTRITLSWADDEDRIGQALERQLVRLLGVLEPLALGNRLLAEGDPVGALAAYDRALAGGDPPGSPFLARMLARIHFHRGLALARLGAQERGWEAFGCAARLDPEFALARELADHMALRTGRGASDRTACASTEAQGRGQLLERAQGLLEQGRPLEARRLFLIARTEPLLARQAQIGLAEAARKSGRLECARDQLLLALARAPGDIELLAALERVEQTRGAHGHAFHLALLQGREGRELEAALADLPQCEAAARLALFNASVPPGLPDGPLRRVLMCLTTDQTVHLTDLRESGEATPTASPPF